MSAPAICTLSGVLYGADGAPYAGGLVRARVYAVTPVDGGDGYLTVDPDSTVTDALGAWSLVLPQSTPIWIEIPSAGVDHLFVVPAVSTATLSDVALVARECSQVIPARSVPIEQAEQIAHVVWAGPVTGTAVPTFRYLVESDIPVLTAYPTVAEALLVANRFSEFSTQAARVAARTNIELEYIDGGVFT